MTYPSADKGPQWFADDHPGTTYPRVEKIVWHTTEGTGWPGYDGGAKAPHYTVLPDFTTRRMRWRAHFPDTMNSRALRNEPGGVQTNLDGALQVEIVGTCDPSRMKVWKGPFLRSWDLEDWQVEGLAQFAAWAFDEHRVPLTAVPRWLAYPGSYGNSSARMPGKAWDAFRGHCGHMHVAENLHGDPGAFQISRVLSAAQRLTTITATEDDNMDLADKLQPLSEAAARHLGNENKPLGYRPTVEECILWGYVFACEAERRAEAAETNSAAALAELADVKAQLAQVLAKLSIPNAPR